jgi:CBS domain-containing protein
MKIKTDFLVKKLRDIEKKRQKSDPLVKDLMSTQVITIDPEEPVINAAEKMLEHRIHALIVLKDNKPIGVIASYDLLLVMTISDYFDKKTKVKDIMIKDLVTVTPEDTITVALKKMIEYNIRRLAVVKDGKLVGIVSLVDLVLGFVDLAKINAELSRE